MFQPASVLSVEKRQINLGAVERRQTRRIPQPSVLRENGLAGEARQNFEQHVVQAVIRRRREVSAIVVPAPFVAIVPVCKGVLQAGHAIVE